MGDRQAERNVQAVEAYFASIGDGREVIGSRDDPEWIERREEQLSGLLHPGFEISFRAPDGTNETYCGADSFADAGRAWLKPWREYRTQLEEAIPVGDHVVVVSRAWALPVEGGEPVESLITFLWTFRDRRVIRMRTATAGRTHSTWPGRAWSTWACAPRECVVHVCREDKSPAA